MTVALANHSIHGSAGVRPGLSRAIRRARDFCFGLAAGLAFVMLLGAPVAFGAAPGAASDPRSFIDGLGSEVLSIIKSPQLSQTQRQEKFRDLFSREFDVPSIGRFVVGRYWNRASPEEQQQYLETFRNYVAAIYAAQFSHYQGESFKSTSARALGQDESVVKAEIDREGSPPINLEFRVTGSAGSFKIVDVTVEGVSLIVTKRDEFSSVLAQEGIKGVMNRMQTALKDIQSA